MLKVVTSTITRHSLLALSIGLAVAGASATGWSKDKELDMVFGYVVLGEQGQQLQGNTRALARVVVEPKKAKDLDKIDCAKVTLRGPGGKKPIDDKVVARTNPNPAGFPIAVCEALIEFSDQYSSDGEKWTATINKEDYTLRLPTVPLKPERAIVIGDSGCRDDKKTQLCDDQAWPFAKTIPSDIAKMIAKDKKATLLVHVGDYRYRDKKQNETDGSPWKNWRKDFFDVVYDKGGKDNLLAMAPWVVARGNHELCTAYGNNGPGWFYLLDPSSTLLGSGPVNQCGAGGDVITAPYLLNFANNFSILMTDSANLQESKVNADQAKQLSGFLTTAAATFSQKENVNRLAWWVTHKPPYAALGATPSLSNDTEQAAIGQQPQGVPPVNIKQLMSGHKHLFQTLDVNPAKNPRMPLQAVVGNSGVALNCKTYNGDQNPLNAAIHSASHFGFIDAQLNNGSGKISGWTLNVYAYAQQAKWGKPELVESCVYPAPAGKEACTILNKAFFPAKQECPSNKGDD